jgi:phage gp46-like protein
VSTFDLSEPASLKDCIWISLHVKRGTFFRDPQRGSEFHLLNKASTATPARASAMAKRALRWLVDAGRISSNEPIVANATLVTDHRLQLDIKVVGADGQPVDLTTFVPVGAMT